MAPHASAKEPTQRRHKVPSPVSVQVSSEKQHHYHKSHSFDAQLSAEKHHRHPRYSPIEAQRSSGKSHRLYKTSSYEDQRQAEKSYRHHNWSSFDGTPSPGKIYHREEYHSCDGQSSSARDQHHEKNPLFKVPLAPERPKICQKSRLFEEEDPNVESTLAYLQDCKKRTEDGKLMYGQIYRLYSLSAKSLLKVGTFEKSIFEDRNIFGKQCFELRQYKPEVPSYIRIISAYLHEVSNRPLLGWEQELKTIHAQYIVGCKSDERDRTQLKPKFVPVPVIEQTPKMKNNPSYESRVAIKKAVEIVPNGKSSLGTSSPPLLSPAQKADPATMDPLKAKAKAAGEFMKTVSEKSSKKKQQSQRPPNIAKILKQTRQSH